jgi:hypothetical protein
LVLRSREIDRKKNSVAEILGLGETHSPLLLGTDQQMAWIMERVLRSPRLPDRLREPSA